ncbi:MULTISPECIES: SMC-Scp complex subunit ScpB [Candidatus Ichthyocystis]|uniref:SMC-Scp complex subunit ScpB n=1 Tax=Candidatus Ichthyocystis TaxID=2929841 RepID=UPI000AA2AD46|nr:MULTISPECIES: SMC-Scp complex subunit ScpB [Ichthyocystis]
MNNNRQNSNDYPSQSCESPDIVDVRVISGGCSDGFVTESRDFVDDNLDVVLEAAIFSSPEPLSIKALSIIVGDDFAESDLISVLLSLKDRYCGRGVELVETAGGWRFLTSFRVQHYLDRLKQIKPPRYSRAVMETLAVIAYKQPVTRGDIEEIRGVSLSPQIVRVLEDRGWIVVKGCRESIGRPALYTTTVQFLDDFGLHSLAELPALQTFGPILEPMDDLSSKEKS